MGVVVFDPAAWRLKFPEMAGCTDAQLNGWFVQAETILDNTDGSIVVDTVQRAQMFDLLVAHLAVLNGATRPSTGAPPGRLSSATEGSVSSQFTYTTEPVGASQAWFTQTRYGAQYWMMTARYRSMRYIASQRSCCAGGARRY
ncbi:hypothetical protein T2_00020 [Ralstonia phage Elie]|uniref:Adaptor protein 1 n=4 Tax=Bakolyvirus TaxID=2843355 RepID=A0A7G5BBP9_9CAUD|nr:virion structural protein [Ralstonia phage Adzire]YP_010052787.1 virion structural protein [Ralstonia phage Bakoly]YP_010077707.1 virion structural protein [Ralstonia phage Simangalove]QMV32965.1 hypothetical protein T2_00020 [Ralstonia phage Elie]QMV33532.1 adaptor protein 1 [Ralstonia phage Jenny]QMV33677.1 adaptor protein 1 [Ralstonia phage Sarlave]QMV32337.1 adaptor protein 1 [Ralstonia phage Adzire]QMV32611.1 adaptor protein 1 [Ralstonia phage Bakoly]